MELAAEIHDLVVEDLIPMFPHFKVGPTNGNMCTNLPLTCHAMRKALRHCFILKLFEHCVNNKNDVAGNVGVRPTWCVKLVINSCFHMT